MPHYRDPQLQVTENYLDLYIQIIQIILCHFHKFKAFFSSLDYTQCTTESERKIIPCFKCCCDLQWNNRLNFMASEFFGQQRGCRFTQMAVETKWRSVWQGLKRRRCAYGTAFWSIKAQIGTPSPDTGRVPIWAFIDRKAVPYAFYRTTTHMFNW